MGFLKYLLLKKRFSNESSFIWRSLGKKFEKINNLKTIDIKLIVSIDRQKKILIENTRSFSDGNFTNNVLLWGARGNGKSTLIKSVFSFISKDNKNLRLIQLNKQAIFDIEYLYKVLSKFKKLRFIIFIDDLSFEEIDREYKIIKSTLDGSIQSQPNNIILYVTSNRRHLMPRDMIENERSSAIHTDESVDEKVSLSDRFGLWIGFHNFSQSDYLNIIKTYCRCYKIKYDKNIELKSVQWSLQRGSRTGRTAWQFILQLASDRNLKIKF
jgi:predicted AAA+ superfamily ATPase